jgi:dTDP-4-dehydrorhamnose reductase
MKVLVTGANGMVAQAMREHCAFLGDEVLAVSRGQLDISDRDSVREAVHEFTPDAVINCAAFTNVDAAESQDSECKAANTHGVENLAVACREADARLVTISTDYVFDGSFNGFYTQRHSPAPLSVYGRAKLEGEVRAFTAYPRSVIVRSGWIFGPGGTNFLSVMPRLLAAGNPITAISDSFGTPTYARDLAVRLREFAAADLPGVYHVANSGEGCSYREFAHKVCELGGSDPGLVAPVSHTELQRPAPRPTNSKLACVLSPRLGFEPLRKWEDALRHFIQDE